MCESADDFYEARYLFTQHSLDHGALPCWVTINKIGKMYGVTESSIRRWKKYYNIV